MRGSMFALRRLGARIGTAGLVACTAENLAPSDQASSVRLLGAVEARLEVPTNVSRGAELPIVVVLTNRSVEPLEFNTLGSPFEFNATVMQSTGRVVWVRNDEPRYALPTALPALAPGESRRFEAKWTLADSAGHEVPAGNYSVSAVLYTDSSYGQVSLGPIRFRIN